MTNNFTDRLKNVNTPARVPQIHVWSFTKKEVVDPHSQANFQNNICLRRARRIPQPSTWLFTPTSNHHHRINQSQLQEQEEDSHMYEHSPEAEPATPTSRFQLPWRATRRKSTCRHTCTGSWNYGHQNFWKIYFFSFLGRGLVNRRVIAVLEDASDKFLVRLRLTHEREKQKVIRVFLEMKQLGIFWF